MSFLHLHNIHQKKMTMLKKKNKKLIHKFTYPVQCVQCKEAQIHSSVRLMCSYDRNIFHPVIQSHPPSSIRCGLASRLGVGPCVASSGRGGGDAVVLDGLQLRPRIYRGGTSSWAHLCSGVPLCLSLPGGDRTVLMGEQNLLQLTHLRPQ